MHIDLVSLRRLSLTLDSQCDIHAKFLGSQSTDSGGSQEGDREEEAVHLGNRFGSDANWVGRIVAQCCLGDDAESKAEYCRCGKEQGERATLPSCNDCRPIGGYHWEPRTACSNYLIGSLYPTIRSPTTSHTCTPQRLRRGKFMYRQDR